MHTPVHHIINNNTFWLSADRCIFWEDEKVLILSDLHFGKTGHFRKSGIAVPQIIYKEDLQRLFSQIQFYQPKKLIIVGDFFHSTDNSEMDLFLKWRNDIANTEIILVKGNHDILKNEWYQTAGIKVIQFFFQIKGFGFIHDIASLNNPETINQKPERLLYTFSGHLHPGINIKSSSRQSLCFPCFYFTENYAVLPAFSKFTGLCIIKTKRKEVAFAIVNQTLVAMHTATKEK